MRRNDPKAFIFTLKNPHGVEPTRYTKRIESKYAIAIISNIGPIFCGDEDGADIQLKNRNGLCYVITENDGTHGYECHPEYKSSLFVNTNDPDIKNISQVLDYEVFAHE